LVGQYGGEVIRHGGGLTIKSKKSGASGCPDRHWGKLPSAEKIRDAARALRDACKKGGGRKTKGGMGKYPKLYAGKPDPKDKAKKKRKRAARRLGKTHGPDQYYGPAMYTPPKPKPKRKRKSKAQSRKRPEAKGKAQLVLIQ